LSQSNLILTVGIFSVLGTETQSSAQSIECSQEAAGKKYIDLKKQIANEDIFASLQLLNSFCSL